MDKKFNIAHKKLVKTVRARYFFIASLLIMSLFV